MFNPWFSVILLGFEGAGAWNEAHRRAGEHLGRMLDNDPGGREHVWANSSRRVTARPRRVSGQELNHLRTRIADGTGVHAYAVDQLLRQMIARAQKLELRVIEPSAPTIEKLLVMLTMQTAGVVHAGYPKVPL